MGNGERERERERERESFKPWRERVEINNLKSEENDYLNKIYGRIDKLMW